MAFNDLPALSTWEDITYIVKDLVQAIDAITTPGMDMLSMRAAIARAIATIREGQCMNGETYRLGALLAGMHEFRLKVAGVYT